MSVTRTTADYVFRIFAALVSDCVVASPCKNAAIYRRSAADAASDERIRVLRILAFVVCAGTSLEVIVRLIGLSF